MHLAFTTRAEETIELCQNPEGTYSVACWDKEGNCRWQQDFRHQHEALKEYERWQYLAAPIPGQNATGS